MGLPALRSAVPPLRDADPVRATLDRDPSHNVLVPELPGASAGAGVGADRADVTELEIACRRAADGRDWTCDVTIAAEGGSTTRHAVTVAQSDLDRLDPGAPDPHLLVDRSFRFLLERESPSSILRSFDLMAIARYFPEYEASIRQGLTPG